MASGTNRRINIFVNGKEVEDKIGGVKAAMGQLNREISQLSVGTDAYNKKAAEIRNLKSVINEHNVAIGQTASNWDKLKGNLVSTGFGVLGGNILTSLTTKVAGFFGGMIDGAAKLSDQFADIQKTTGMTTDEVEGLNNGLKKIDTRTAVSELRNIAIVAGQLGIVKTDVAGFTEAVDKINVALGDEIVGGADVVASTVGKLRNVLTDMKSDAVDQDLLKLGNALNELGAAGFATAPVVAELSNRIGSIAIPLGFTSAQVMGLAATFQELNIAEERGGTAMGKILQKMTQNTGTFAQVAGMDVKTFTNLVNNDLYGAFMKVVEGSKKGGNSATLMSGIIKELEVNGAGASEVFMKLSGNVGMANEKVALAGKALEGTGSIMNEFDLKNNNFAGTMAKAGKDINGFFMGIGQKIAPAVASVVTSFADFLKWIKRNGDGLVFLGKVVGVAAVSLVSYSLAAKLSAMWTKRNTEAGLLKIITSKAEAIAETVSIAAIALKNAALALLSGNLKKATMDMRLFNAAISANPIGLVIGVITAAATAYMLFKQSSSSAKDVLEDYNGILKSHIESVNNEKQGLNLLVGEIMRTNEKSTLRVKLIKELQQKYPDFLKNMDAEKITNVQLAKALSDVNKGYDSKLRYAAVQAKSEAIQKRMLDNAVRQLEIEDELNTNRNDKSGKNYDVENERLNKEHYSLQLQNDVLQKRNEELGKDSAAIKLNSSEQSVEVLKSQIINAKNLLALSEQIIAKEAKGNDMKTKQAHQANLVLKKEAEDNIKLLEEKLKVAEDFEKNKKNGKGKTNDGSGIDPTEEEKKKQEEFKKDFAKWKEDQLQIGMDAQDKELRQLDIYYADLIKRAKENGGDVTALENAWGEDKLRIGREYYAKFSEQENKAAEEYTAQVAKDKAEELKLMEDSLKELGVIQLNAIKKNHVDGKTSKKEYEDQVKQQEIAQLEMLIELRKKYGLDVLALESELQDKLIAVIEGNDNGNSKDKNADYLNKLFNTDKAREKIDQIAKMVGELSNIWGGVLQIQANKEEKEFRTYKKGQESKKKELDKRLKSGAISQQQYDDEVAKIDAETEARQKQMAYDQAKRERTLGIFNSIIATAVAVTQALPNLILAGLVAAAGAVQVGVIASAPLPELAAGGYTDGVSIAGEKGKEWVASNTLLRNPVTAPVIGWLEDYQRGRTKQPLTPAYDQISTAIQNRQSSGVAQSNKNLEVLILQLISKNTQSHAEIVKLNGYLSDPNNRKARIVRDELTKFDSEMSTLKELAKIGK